MASWAASLSATLLVGRWSAGMTRSESSHIIRPGDGFLPAAELLSAPRQNEGPCYPWPWVIKNVLIHSIFHLKEIPSHPPRFLMVRLNAALQSGERVFLKSVSLVSTTLFHTWINNIYYILLLFAHPSLSVFQQQTLSYSCAPRTCVFYVVLMCAMQQPLHLSTWFLMALSKLRMGEKGLKSPICSSSGQCEKMPYWDMCHCTCNERFQSNFFPRLPLAGAECIWSSNVCVKLQTACSGVSFLLGLSVFFVLLPKWGIWKKARAPFS